MVADGAEPKIGDATIMGRPGVMLVVSSQYGANTLEVTRALDAAIDEITSVMAANEVTLHRGSGRPISS